MFAIVKDGVVQQLVRSGTQFKSEGVTYHPTWCTNTNADQKAAIGMVPVVAELHPDTRFYWETEPTAVYDADTNTVTVTYTKNPKLLEDRLEVDSDGNPLYVKELGTDGEGNPVMVDSSERLVSKGIKTWYPAVITQQAEQIKAASTDEEYIAQVDAELARITAAIQAATSVDEVAAIQQNWPRQTI